MSRSGYWDDCDDTWALVRWRGAVASAIRGKRGQLMLRELLSVLDSMGDKRLSAGSLINADGQYCALGALGAARGINLTEIDPYDREAVAEAFGISEALAAEIMYFNDDAISDSKYVFVEICGPLRPWERRFACARVPVLDHEERRWRYMRDWVAKRIN